MACALERPYRLAKLRSMIAVMPNPRHQSGMANLTDTASDLHDVAERLSSGSSKQGSVYLAERFGVVPWSTDFVRILASLQKRADMLLSVLRGLPLNERTQERAGLDIATFKRAFEGDALTRPWHDAQHGGAASLSSVSGSLLYLSDSVRVVESYPNLTQEEAQELLLLIDDFIESVRGDLEMPYWTRRLLESALSECRFALIHLKWTGGMDLLDALRDLKFAEEQLRLLAEETPSLLADRWLGMTKALFQKFYGMAGTAKDGWENFAFLKSAVTHGAAFALPYITSSVPLLKAP